MAAAPAEVLPDGAWVDEFDTAALDEHWTVLNESTDNWSRDAEAGELTLTSMSGDTHQTNNSAPNVFLLEVPVGDFTAVTSFEGAVDQNFQGAGFLALDDLDNYVRSGLAHVDTVPEGPVVIESAVETRGAFASSFVSRPGSTGETLRLEREGDTLTTSYWADDAWVVAAEKTVGFDITQVGLYAFAAGAAAPHTVTFDYFAITPAPSMPSQEPEPPAVVSGGLTIDGDATDVEMSPDLYGLFYEDINYAGDGGLYAELVRNRSFEFDSSDNQDYTGMTGWDVVERNGAAATTAVVSDEGRLNETNRFYLDLETSGAGAGVRNGGFNTREGVPVVSGNDYEFSVWARSATAQTLTVAVEDAAGTTTYATGTVAVDGSDEWKQYSATLTATGSTTSGRFTVLAGAAGALALDMVSLMPDEQFDGPVNGEYGLRKDLGDKLAALDPSFLRFPGGCVIAGTWTNYADSDYEDRRRAYFWKETIGPLEERATNFNWWGYNQTFGLGYLEYFMLAEDLGAEPLPVLPVGTNACGGPPATTDPETLDMLIQDTLDLIEFANGSADTVWGAVRAELGHPEPFGLEYIGLGNEDSQREYFANFPLFKDAIREAYPDMKIASNSSFASQGALFDELWDFAAEQEVDLVDEHYYNDPDWFLANTHRYDSYDRSGPGVFIGEYASRGNTFYNAMAEAAYMTGLERNSDIVKMASYAPIFANEDYVQWRDANMIYFDNDESWGTPNYHVQQLFSTNRGDQVVPSQFDTEEIEVPTEDVSGGVFLSTWATSAAYDNLEVTAESGEVLYAEDFSDGAADWTPERGTWAVTDGRYVQSSTTVEDARSLAPDAYGQDWTNYSFELEATKLAGNEGFLVGFAANGAQDFYWWNLGGWGNTRSVLERADGARQGEVAAKEDVQLVTGQTYDIRVEVDGPTVRLFLDGELHLEYSDAVPTEVLHHVVTRDTETDDLLVKVVNSSPATIATDVSITDVEVEGTGTAIEMTADSLTATNTKEDPDNVVPVSREITGLGSEFTYSFPANSITFLRLGVSDLVGPTFADVVEGQPFYDDIRWLADNRLSTGSEVGGQTLFQPKAALSRQALAAFLHRYAGSPSYVPTDPPFTDVRPEDTFFTEIGWMQSMGYARGNADGSFGQTEPVTREAVAAFLHRMAGSPAVPDAESFPDVPADSAFADAIAWLAGTGITEGRADGTFGPTESITREAVAAFLHRYDALPPAG
ncbi:alpha-L-arabinofuranosidase C-terminal domain-containing protein [Cellulomonas aerilata]|uniref:alpha-L-arabinofuranosidase C-terminal domain-containing protein n=1 Tax=Cellulomonas aerilata TaxID=515326 RepID=UPI001649F4D9|nr:alpha-L-arabinofuranosidase C-terminal domain-containing protein [Cellulomonas aerilata]